MTDTKFLPSHVTTYHTNIDIVENQQYRDCCDEIAALPYDKARHELRIQEQVNRIMRARYRRRDDTSARDRPHPAEVAESGPTFDSGVIGPFHDGWYHFLKQAQGSLEAKLHSDAAGNTSDGQSSGLPPTEDAKKNLELAAFNSHNQANETPVSSPQDAGEVAATGTANETEQSSFSIALSKASHRPTVQGGGTADNYDGGGAGVT